MKKDGREREKEKTALGGGCPGEGRASEVDPAVQEKNVGRLPAEPSGAEVWRAARYANPRAGTTVEALTDRDGKQTNTSLEKEEMVRHKSFPPNDGDQYYELPPAGSAHTRVTEQAVELALFSQSVKKAPGPDELSFGAIQLLWKWDTERIVRPTRGAIRTGRHPAV